MPRGLYNIQIWISNVSLPNAIFSKLAFRIINVLSLYIYIYIYIYIYVCVCVFYLTPAHDQDVTQGQF